jgi:hypothetical protein
MAIHRSLRDHFSIVASYIADLRPATENICVGRQTSGLPPPVTSDDDIHLASILLILSLASDIDTSTQIRLIEKRRQKVRVQLCR